MAGFSSQRGVLSTLVAITFFLQAVLAGHAVKHVERTPEAMAAHIHETRDLLFARADNIAITGVQNNGASPRLEVRDLAANSDAWNLYLLGLERFKSKSQSDPLSYYQVAGVHGVPYVSWNNYALKHQAGYCPHAQTLFGSWHRPYLAVYEQAWYSCVQEVVNEFSEPDRTNRWGPAASGLRMPYWDWAKAPPSGECTVPSLITDQQVSVTKSTGQVSIDNPLYQYSWGNSLPQELSSGPNRNNAFTLRHPVAGNPMTSNNAEFCSDINNNRISIRDRVYGLFSSRAATGDVTSEQVGVSTSQNGGSADSFESLHDLIHVLTGGGAANGNDGGHMWYLDWSSFDPVFWLHHTNIDRLISMYQVMDTNGQVNNGKFVTGNTFRQDRAEYSNGDYVDSSTPLWPFRKNTGNDYYTSDDVRDTTVLGYTYPETGSGANAQSVGQVINDLYGPNANNNPTRAVSSAISSVASRLSSAIGAASSAAPTGVSSAASSAASSGAASAASSGASAASSAAASSNGPSGGSAASSGASSTQSFQVLPTSANGGSKGSGGSGASAASSGASSASGNGKGASSTQSIKVSPTGINGGSGGSGSSTGSGSQYPGRPFEDGDYHTICSIYANKYAVDGSYIINFYLGGSKQSSGNNSTFPFKNSTSSGGSYSSRDGFIGSFAVLGMSQQGNSTVVPVEMQASIPLTSALQGKQASGDLKSLGPDDVTAYLKQHFSYIIVGKGGEIDPLSISGLHFGVSTAKVSPAKSSSDLPSFGKFESLPKVTENMPCGQPYTPNPSAPYNPTPASGSSGSSPSGGSSGGSYGGGSSGSPSGAASGAPSSSKPTGAPIASQFPSYGGGQCKTQQTVVYVDQNGKFLYQQVGSPQ